MKINFRYTGEYQSEYSQRIGELVEYILEQDYGTTIPFERCANYLHYNIEDEKEFKEFKNTMARVKNFLIDKGYVLKSITGVGYYILKPKQISGYCYHTYIRRTENLLNKSSRILSHVETHELSEIRKEEYDNVCDLNSDITNVIDTTIEKSKYYSRKSYYDNLED